MFKRLLRYGLWKIVGRDFLVLRPDWSVLHRRNEMAVVGAPVEPLLPVAYDFLVSSPWRLEYEIRGQEEGELHYALGAAGKKPFCEVTLELELPFRWNVVLEDDMTLRGNGAVLPLSPGATLPRDAHWLTAQFCFTPAQGRPLRRRAGHRVVAPGTDRDYFQGNVYDDYEVRPGMFPQRILEHAEKLGLRRGRLLDVGCATGLLVSEARARGWHAEGIDVSSWAVARAEEKHPGTCRVLDFDRATPEDFGGSYDLIVLHSVLEHLGDPARALQVLHSLCAPGGMVYVQTLNADSFMHKLCGHNWSGYSDYTHRSPWITAAWLARQAEQAGFDVRELKRYGVWNENQADDAWQTMAWLWEIGPARTLLEDEGGDFLEAMLQRPALTPNSPS